jgi:transposase
MVSEQKSSLPLQVQQCVNDLLDTLIVLKIILLNMTGFCPRKTDHRSQRLMELKGIGPTTGALVASIGNAHDFKNGRQLAVTGTNAIAVQQWWEIKAW